MCPSSADLQTCARHDDRAAVTTCRDCSQPLCTRCTVELPDLGTFCWGCAARRGGLRARRQLRAEPAGAAPEPVPLATVRHDEAEAVHRFEVLVSGRAPRPLISGLTARLEQAGADPEDVVDDEELTEDIARMQAQARESEHHPSTHRWFHRR